MPEEPRTIFLSLPGCLGLFVVKSGEREGELSRSKRSSGGADALTEPVGIKGC